LELVSPSDASSRVWQSIHNIQEVDSTEEVAEAVDVDGEDNTMKPSKLSLVKAPHLEVVRANLNKELHITDLHIIALTMDITMDITTDLTRIDLTTGIISVQISVDI
jgi:hypothetical protein